MAAGRVRALSFFSLYRFRTLTVIVDLLLLPVYSAFGHGKDRKGAMAEEVRPLEHIEESDLVEMAKSDPEAFGELYERYVDRIFNYIYYRTGSREDAEDLTAQVFHRALKHIVKYEDRGLPFTAWLYRIGHNLIVNWHRDRKRRKMVSIDDVAPQKLATRKGPELFAEKNDDNAMLLAAISALPEDRQQLLYLKYLENMSNAEIGEVLGRSEGAIKSLYYRTLLNLRTEILRMENLPHRDD